MEWYRREYKGKEFQEGVPVIITEKGERVRSKTEKMLADFFYRKEISICFDFLHKCYTFVKTGII